MGALLEGATVGVCVVKLGRADGSEKEGLVVVAEDGNIGEEAGVALARVGCRVFRKVGRAVGRVEG